MFGMSPLHPGIQLKVTHLLVAGCGHSMYPGGAEFKLGAVEDAKDGNSWTMELAMPESCAQCS